MEIKGNVVFITGGGSGIGRGLAEALHAKGNQVIISGRRKDRLEEVTKANPGMDFVTLDIENPQSISAAAATLVKKYPKLNVLINNAGIMQPDNVDKPIDDKLAEAIITTNLLGPIRMCSALIEHLKTQPKATIVNVTSGLAFTPLASAATYSATKAAMHSFSLSQRYMLKDSNVRILEIAPPYVQTELTGSQQASDPRAMPLKDFIDETMQKLATDTNEVLVERVGMLRNGAGVNDNDATTKLNDMFGSQ